MAVALILSLLCGNAYGALQSEPPSDAEGKLLPKLLSVLSEADALQVGNSLTRRNLLQRAAGAVPLALAAPSFAAGNQDGKTVDDLGAIVQTNKDGKPKTILGEGATKKASELSGRGGGKLPTIRVSGTWKDPAHPGGYRKISLVGNNAIINGADEDGKPWKVKGVLQGNSIIIDFTPKGGPKDVEGKYVVGKGIVFPDGNTWYK